MCKTHKQQYVEESAMENSQLRAGYDITAARPPFNR